MAGEVSLEGLTEQEIRGFAALHTKILGNPNSRKKFLGLIKEVNPEFTAPELEVESAMSTARAELAERQQAIEARAKAAEEAVEKINAERAEEKAREKWKELKEAPIKAGIIEAGDMEAVEKLMKDEGYTATQYMAAAKHYAASKVLAAPTPGTITPFRKPDNKELLKDPRKFFQDSVIQGLSESQARKVQGKFGQA